MRCSRVCGRPASRVRFGKTLSTIMDVGNESTKVIVYRACEIVARKRRTSGLHYPAWQCSQGKRSWEGRLRAEVPDESAARLHGFPFTLHPLLFIIIPSSVRLDRRLNYFQRTRNRRLSRYGWLHCPCTFWDINAGSRRWKTPLCKRVRLFVELQPTRSLPWDSFERTPRYHWTG